MTSPSSPGMARATALEIEVLLPADALRALEAMRRGGESGVDIAALELQRLGDEGAAGGARIGDIGDMRQVLVLDLRQRAARRASSRVSAMTAKSGWPEMDRAGGEDRVVVLAGRADVVVPGMSAR